MYNRYNEYLNKRSKAPKILTETPIRYKSVTIDPKETHDVSTNSNDTTSTSNEVPKRRRRRKTNTDISPETTNKEVDSNV